MNHALAQDKIKSKSESSLLDGLLIASVLMTAILPRLHLLATKSFEIFNADQAVIGIMGKHILEGKPMVYFYGQGYMGSLEAFMAALIFSIKGMSLLSLQCAPLAFFLLFLITAYILLKKVFSRTVALISALILAVSVPDLNILSVTSLGGYPETLFFGALVLFGAYSLFCKASLPLLFFTGMAAGIGFWVNNLILLFFLSFILFFFLQSPLWQQIRSRGWRGTLFMQNVPIPAALRWGASALHLFYIAYFVWNLIAFFAGAAEITIAGQEIQLASPLFHVKKLKKVLITFGIEMAVLAVLLIDKRRLFDQFKRILPGVLGFSLGSSPVWIYSLLGGDGYRIVHASAVVYFKDIPGRLAQLMGDGFMRSLLGVPVRYLKGSYGLDTLFAVAMAATVLGLLFAYFFQNRREIKDLLYLKATRYSAAVYPLILTALVLFICLFNTLQSNRYLLPAYLGLAVMLALPIAKVFEKKKWAGALLLSWLLSCQAYANFDHIRSIPSRTDIQGHFDVLDYLERENIRGGYANYWHSYLFNFLGAEKTIFAAYRSPERYPHYTKYVDGLSGKVAYALKKTDNAYDAFGRRLLKSDISYQKKWVDPFMIFIFDRQEVREKNLV